MTKLFLTAFILFALFFAMCFAGTGTTKKNIKSFYSYPDKIQARIRKNKTLAAMIPKKPSVATGFASNLILFTVVFCVVGMLLGFNTFRESFGYFLILGQGLNLFDLLIVDLLWWRRTKRTRFSEIEAEEELYANPKKHIQAFLRGVPMFFCAALLSALIMNCV